MRGRYADRFPAESIVSLQELNRKINQQDLIYSLPPGRLTRVEVWPVEYEIPEVAKPLLRETGVDVGIRVADRYVALDNEQAEALIKALRIAIDSSTAVLTDVDAETRR